ncbi:unnamed protein product, partial [marine sediment metagenome]
MTFDPPATQVYLEAVQDLRNDIVDLFQVADTTLDDPEPGYVRFRGQFLQDPAHCFDELRERFERHGFTPKIEQQNDLPVLIAFPGVILPRESNPNINLLLFLATILSTLIAGASYVATTTNEYFMLWRGWPFSLSIMLILSAHEMGHYIVARHHKVPTTLPYFIPFPIPLTFGTFGAVILLKDRIKNKRALLDVGAAGPWAGMVFAIPIYF